QNGAISRVRRPRPRPCHAHRRLRAKDGPMPAIVAMTLATAGVVTSKRISTARIDRLRTVVTPLTARDRMMRPIADTLRCWGGRPGGWLRRSCGFTGRGDVRVGDRACGSERGERRANASLAPSPHGAVMRPTMALLATTL